MPRISVLMPVYNSTQYLVGAIESVLGQTFDDFEFIIVNDGSEEDVGSVVESFDDPRIVYVENDENIGLTKSLNKALDISTGDVFARQDADDYSLPTRFEKQLERIGGEVGLVATYGIQIDAEGNKVHHGDYLWTQIRIKESNVKRILRSRNCILGPSAMFSREVFDKIGYYDEVMELAQDYNYWLRLTEFFKCAIVREELYALREHGRKVSHTRRKSWPYSKKLSMAQSRAKTHTIIKEDVMDQVPNRFLRNADMRREAMSSALSEIEDLWVNRMRGKAHPGGADDPESVKIHWSREWEYPWAVENSDLKPGDVALDCGCGGSPLLPYLVTKTNCCGVGIDRGHGRNMSTKPHDLLGSDSPLVSLWGYMVGACRVTDPRFHIEKGDMTDIAYADDSFDHVFCISVIEHIPTEAQGKKAIEEMVRVLKPGGRLLITMDHTSYQGHVAPRCIGQFRKIIEWSGLSLMGGSDFTVPSMEEIHGKWHVVAFVLEKPGGGS